MVRNRGGLLASTGVTALGLARFAAFGRVPDGDQGGGGGAAVVEEDFFADAGAGGDGGQGAGGDGGAGAGGEGGEGGGDQGGAAVAPAEWMKSFSAEKTGDELSNQEWLAKIGAKDLDDVASRYRQLEKAHRESGKVKIPAEGASEAEIKSYREAIGAPLEVDGYAIELPAAAEGYEIDSAFLDPMKAIAFKHNIPAAAFKDLGDAFVAAQLQSAQEEAAVHNTDKAAKLKEWGADAEQGKEEFRRGASILGLKTADIAKIQNGYGAGPTLDLLRKIGQLGGEDFFAGNGQSATQQFGVADGASAQKAIDAMIADPDTAKKIRAKDPVVSARYNRLTEALAHFKQIEANGSGRRR